MRNPASKTWIYGFMYGFLSLFRRRLNVSEDKQDARVERYWEKCLCNRVPLQCPHLSLKYALMSCL